MRQEIATMSGYVHSNHSRQRVGAEGRDHSRLALESVEEGTHLGGLAPWKTLGDCPEGFGPRELQYPQPCTACETKCVYAVLMPYTHLPYCIICSILHAKDFASAVEERERQEGERDRLEAREDSASEYASLCDQHRSLQEIDAKLLSSGALDVTDENVEEWSKERRIAD